VDALRKIFLLKGILKKYFLNCVYIYNMHFHQSIM